VSQHQIGVFGGLELGVLAEFVHHLVCGAQNLEIGQHDFLSSSVDRIAGIRDRIVGFAFQAEQRRCPSAGTLAICAISTGAALSEGCRTALIPPLSELEQKTIPSETARP
jgi:hypothetical protein